jgi:hypothetical protein
MILMLGHDPTVEDIIQELGDLISRLNNIYTQLEYSDNIRCKIWFHTQWLQEKQDGVLLLNQRLSLVRDRLVEQLNESKGLIQDELDTTHAKRHPRTLGTIPEADEFNLEYSKVCINYMLYSMNRDACIYETRVLDFMDASERGGYRNQPFWECETTSMSPLNSMNTSSKSHMGCKKRKSIYTRMEAVLNKIIGNIYRLSTCIQSVTHMD